MLLLTELVCNDKDTVNVPSVYSFNNKINGILKFQRLIFTAKIIHPVSPQTLPLASAKRQRTKRHSSKRQMVPEAAS
jgi:hypothetical protein